MFSLNMTLLFVATVVADRNQNCYQLIDLKGLSIREKYQEKHEKVLSRKILKNSLFQNNFTSTFTGEFNQENIF